MSALARMEAAWGPDAPDWVRALAEECERTSQRVAATAIGYSPAAVSNVLKARYGRDGYGGDLRAVEQAVRGALMGAEIDCPELGPIPAHGCLEWQRRAATLITTNPLRLRMYRACRSCPRARIGGNHDHAT